ncbi:MAG TPA: ABC transporter permease [Planctomycetota bacterium]|jgi:putative ABC transport system permease protein|nr:ABC transporter permease [Planctomycetota bacterium]OQC20617.1 MAG: Macrolide export ATP-binding/permease protein MacB [Planctomycetes bacterium ADurb.Bin069]HNR98741.1 ABC transporter permease [Planctomycetota bacterium]HNU25449.1 ABC transporter permease [Planctomycetota bacterium]HOE30427.1 ABC transporter permease [Planctomycetota bacterium]
MPLRPPLCIREAVLGAARRPLRSLFVLQAIIWGSAAAVFPQALFTGTREASLSRAGQLAADRIIAASPDGPVLTSWDEIAAVAAAIPRIKAITGVAVEKSAHGCLVGTDGANLNARRRTLARGRNFNSGEIARGDAVCIVEPRAMGDDGSPGGAETLVVAGRTLRVIGQLADLPAGAGGVDPFGLDDSRSFTFLARMVLAEFGIMPPGMDWLNRDQAVLAPWRVLGAPPRWLVLRAEPEEVGAVMEDLQAYFARRGTQILCYSNLIIGAIFKPELEGLLALSRDIFIACLVMGVAVVGTAMLIAVNERRREIAIRRCEGATAGAIVAQFLLETGVFCLLGSALGIPFGLALAWTRARLDPSVLLSWGVPWGHIAFIVACVFAGGVLAGCAPAYRAARLDPVEVFSRG